MFCTIWFLPLQLVCLFPSLGTNQNSLSTLQHSSNKSRSSYAVNPADVGQLGINNRTNGKYQSAYYNKSCCEAIWPYSRQSCQSVAVVEFPTLSFEKPVLRLKTVSTALLVYSASATRSGNNAVHCILMISRKAKVYFLTWWQIISACHAQDTLSTTWQFNYHYCNHLISTVVHKRQSKIQLE